MKQPDLQIVVDQIADEMAQQSERGVVADYIPTLASVSPSHFGMTIIDHDGNCYMSGDADVAFSIQSISKVFSLTMALGFVGDGLWSRVGREPSGSAFNSIVQLEWEQGIPRNPFINAGAIVVADILLGRYEPREILGEFLRFMHTVTGDDTITIDEAVAKSENETGFRNRALANYMRAYGNIENTVERNLGVYFHLCSLSMSCHQLASAGRYLMCGGRRAPGTSDTIISQQRAKRILALMMMCGHYDGSGEFAYRVGLPGKSGVGGGILAIAPGIASIAVWFPGLNSQGNSQLGSNALERLVELTGWSVFRTDQ
ncbi:glutaminase [Algimonas arctica]|uniref:Glutaminase n=1 Tax=Algimonas arctica TaxID=1479486 RepID=A0A8J3G1C9_9PROT|nr:glutaminase [Algimonas arctica]GHA83899.1 glutaminase [Algimonas arctica]